MECFDNTIGKPEDLVSKFKLLSTGPSRWGLSLGRCHMRPNTGYDIDRIEKERPNRVIVHHLRERIIYEYQLPKQYADLVTGKDIEEINSGKGI